MMISRSAGRLALLCSAMLVFAAAEAQSAVRFVATTGSNANPCTRTQPCRQLQRAVNVAVAGDEIQILDSGEYLGTVNIGNSVTISADGVSATLLHTAAAGPGVLINGPGIIVTLRGLLLSGGGVGLQGITIRDAAAVHIKNCEAERFAGDGILVSDSPTEVHVSDSVSRLNSRRGLAFVTDVAARLTVENSHFENNGGHGLNVSGPIESAIGNSIMSGNGGNGILQSGGRMNVTKTTVAGNGAFGARLTAGQMTLEDSLSDGNATGLQVDAGAIGRISNSVFTHNNFGIRNNGTTRTRRNNIVSGNTTELAGAPLSPLAGQ